MIDARVIYTKSIMLFSCSHQKTLKALALFVAICIIAPLSVLEMRKPGRLPQEVACCVSSDNLDSVCKTERVRFVLMQGKFLLLFVL